VRRFLSNYFDHLFTNAILNKTLKCQLPVPVGDQLIVDESWEAMRLSALSQSTYQIYITKTLHTYLLTYFSLLQHAVVIAYALEAGRDILKILLIYL